MEEVDQRCADHNAGGLAIRGLASLHDHEHRACTLEARTT